MAPEGNLRASLKSQALGGPQRNIKNTKSPLGPPRGDSAEAPLKPPQETKGYSPNPPLGQNTSKTPRKETNGFHCDQP